MAKKSTTTEKTETGLRLIKSGRYEKRFSIDGVRYSVYGRTKKECTAKETEKRLAIAAGTYKKNSSVTLNEYFKEWAAHKGATVSPATIHLYHQQYKHLKKPLGRYKVCAIERRQVVNVLTVIAEKVSKYTANACKNLLLQIFKSAQYDEIITINPIENIPNFKDRGAAPARETIHRALTDEEIVAFMGAVGNSYYRQAFRFMLATGVRSGECAALEWKDIDTKNGLIHIRRTTTRNRAGKLIIGDTTKTPKSRRDIPINREIADILNTQKAQSAAFFGDIIQIDCLVFPGTKGQAVAGTLFNNLIEYAINKYNRENEQRPPQERGITLKRFCVHAFRDTFASKAAAAGVPLNVLKELLGHSSYAMTADLYGHIYDEQKKDAMKDLTMISM